MGPGAAGSTAGSAWGTANCEVDAVGFEENLSDSEETPRLFPLKKQAASVRAPEQSTIASCGNQPTVQSSACILHHPRQMSLHPPPARFSHGAPPPCA